MTPANLANEKVQMVEWFDDHFYKIKTASGVEYYPSTTTVLGATAKPFLARWRGDIGNREADLRMHEAAERGTRLHNAWSIYCQGGAVVYQPYQRPTYTYDDLEALRIDYVDRVAILPTQDEMYQMTKLKSWFEAIKPSKVITESIVYSNSNKRAGTADNFFGIEEGTYKVNGREGLSLKRGLYVADLKSGSVVDDDAYMQISDYAHDLEEMALDGVEWAKELIDGWGSVAGGLIIHTSAKTKSGIEGLATHFRSKEELDQDYKDMQNVAEIWRRKNKNSKPDVFEFPSIISRTDKGVDK